MHGQQLDNKLYTQYEVNFCKMLLWEKNRGQSPHHHTPMMNKQFYSLNMTKTNS